MSQFFDRRFWSRTVLAIVAALSLGVLAAAGASAQRNNDDDDEQGGSDRVFSPEVGEIVSEAQEFMAADPPDQASALADLDRALERRGVSAYELGVILQLRAFVKYRWTTSRARSRTGTARSPKATSTTPTG